MRYFSWLGLFLLVAGWAWAQTDVSDAAQTFVIRCPAGWSHEPFTNGSVRFFPAGSKAQNGFVICYITTKNVPPADRTPVAQVEEMKAKLAAAGMTALSAAPIKLGGRSCMRWDVVSTGGTFPKGARAFFVEIPTRTGKGGYSVNCEASTDKEFAVLEKATTEALTTCRFLK